MGGQKLTFRSDKSRTQKSFPRPALELLQEFDKRVSRSVPFVAELELKTGLMADYRNVTNILFFAFPGIIETLALGDSDKAKIRMSEVLNGLRNFRSYEGYVEHRFEIDFRSAGAFSKEEFVESLMASGNANEAERISRQIKELGQQKTIPLDKLFGLFKELAVPLFGSNDSVVRECASLEPHLPIFQKMLDELTARES